MKLTLTAFVAWVAGLAVCLLAGWAMWHQPISPGDLRAVVFGSLLVVSVSVAAGYGPLMFALRKYIFFQRRAWTFPVVGASIAVIPVCLVLALAGGGRGSLLSPEAVLLWVMFVVFGLTLGFGFWLFYVRGSA